MITLCVALAGGLGAGTRYSVDAWVRPRVSPRLPWATQVVNVSGSFALGLLVGAGTADTWLTIAGTGFLGGYTTFSAASLEAAELGLDRRYGAAVTHAVTMLVLSVGAAALGYALGRAAGS